MSPTETAAAYHERSAADPPNDSVVSLEDPMTKPHSILFVDDEPCVLSGLRRMLYPFRAEWEVATATSGEAALEMMQARPFDVVVSDMRMPSLTGVELLARVRVSHPETVRFILTGQSSRAALMAAAGPTHQILSKPCDPSVLRNALRRSLRLRSLLRDTALAQEGAGLNGLPSLPALYVQITEALASDEASASRVGELVARDPGMAVKMLQVVNSPFFGMSRPIADPVRAVVLLGVDAVRGLVLTLHVFDALSGAALAGIPMERLFQRGVLTARLARHVALDLGLDQAAQEEAYLAGLMHDVGYLVTASCRPAELQQFLQTPHADWLEDERLAFGGTHAAIGAYLMGLWGMPDNVLDAVAHHHDLGVAEEEGGALVKAVQLADRLLAEQIPLAFDPIGPADQWPTLPTAQLEAWRAHAQRLAAEDDPHG